LVVAVVEEIIQLTVTLEEVVAVELVVIENHQVHQVVVIQLLL